MYITTCTISERIQCVSIYDKTIQRETWRVIGVIPLQHQKPLIQAEIEALQRKYQNPYKLTLETVRYKLNK